MQSTHKSGLWTLCLTALAVCCAGCSTTAPKQKPKAPPAAVATPAPPVVSSPTTASAAPGLEPFASTSPGPAPETPAAPAAPVAPTAPATLTGGPPPPPASVAPPPRVLDKNFPQPPILDRDVNFWIRVYTEIGTNAGYLHDQYNLGVVYETLQFDPGMSARQRERLVENHRQQIAAALKRIAHSSGPLSPQDQHIRDMWGDAYTPVRVLSAVEDIRFQLGQSDRFREGLVRSGLWQAHIEQTLADLGLPPELGVLPHVESSFNAAAYSKAGAAGMWQFMRSTGRRYLRIDSAVDDRMDPFRSTEAAAQLLSFNYRLLGTWPLALTAYNHGAEGMRRAKEQVGSDDIAMVVRNYHSPSFGFASRNYYVSFLAALTVDKNPEKYFGPIKREPEAKFQDVSMPGFVTVSALTHALHISADQLRRLNPALLPACWEGRRRVPKGYVLRLPLSGPEWSTELLAQRLSPSDLRERQTVPEKRKVMKGETLASIAGDYGMKAGELARLNNLKAHSRLRPGRYLLVPEANPVRVAAVRVDHGADNAPGGEATVAAVAAASPSSAPPAQVSRDAVAAPSSAPTEASSAPVLVAANTPSTPKTADTANAPDVADVSSAPSPQAPGPTAAAPASGLIAANNEPNGPVAPDVAPETNKGGVSPQVAQQESEQDARAVSQDKPLAVTQPVSAKQAEELTPGLGPTSVVSSDNADATDYSVAADDTIVVAPTETLGAYAGWLDIGPGRLRSLNHLRGKGAVRIGHKLKLDFANSSHEKFEAQRRDYHRQLEAAYFASHRISGTRVHVARAGDSLWNLAHRFGDLPAWLLQQYNPDVAFDELRAGTQIVLPRVEDLGNAAADN
ncbi:MAG TPA: transglycosylase SLT domain-containing protein [Steroidobacteraceae bacterium]|nr:transglycosylase SLT domain-containing protein [Steroidobacteraceae bacterium]